MNPEPVESEGGAERFSASFLNFKVIKVPAGSDFKVGSQNFKFLRRKKIPCSGGGASLHNTLHVFFSPTQFSFETVAFWNGWRLRKSKSAKGSDGTFWILAVADAQCGGEESRSAGPERRVEATGGGGGVSAQEPDQWNRSQRGKNEVVEEFWA